MKKPVTTTLPKLFTDSETSLVEQLKSQTSVGIPNSFWVNGRYYIAKWSTGETLLNVMTARSELSPNIIVYGCNEPDCPEDMKYLRLFWSLGRRCSLQLTRHQFCGELIR